MNKIKFKPFGLSYLVELPPINKYTKGGIEKSPSMMEEELKKLPDYLVVACVSDDLIDIKVGDKVILTTTQLPKIKIDGVEYGVCSRHSTVGVFL